MPGSPRLGPDIGYDDVVMMSHEDSNARSPDFGRSRDALIDIDEAPHAVDSSPPSPGPLSASAAMRHRASIHPAEGDVCFPQEGMSDIGDEEYRLRLTETETQSRRRERRRGKKWPDLSYLEEWSVLEKEERTLEGIRARKVSEPIMIGGRLRPSKAAAAWHRTEDDAPYRFTYFNENFDNTIHSQTISELLQDGQTFRDLFVPEPPELSDSSSDEEEEDGRSSRAHMDDSTFRSRALSPMSATLTHSRHESLKHESMKQDGSRPPSVRGKVTPPSANGSGHPDRQSSPSRTNTPTPTPQQQPSQKRKRYGQRPVFWLDVMSPTDAEMRVISKTFNIHPLTAEDILMQEEREKVELFRNYYFVSYRTFEQDTNSEDYLEPVNMYFVVFGEGVLSVCHPERWSRIQLTYRSSTSPRLRIQRTSVDVFVN